MTVVNAGQTVALLSQWYDYEGGQLVDLDAPPDVGIINASTGVVALTPTDVGVIHAGTGTYSYGWATPAALTPGTYVVDWAGQVATVDVAATESVTVLAATAVTTPPATAAGPCGWVISKCGCSSVGGVCWDSHTPATRTRAAALASFVMWAATGRRYGLCETVVLPCNPPPTQPLYESYPLTSTNGYDPLNGSASRVNLIGGQWFNNGCGGSGCSCRAACEVRLDGPVDEILEVTVDGDILPVSAYEVHNRSVLVRKDGDCWPTCQVVGTEIPGFVVVYLRGDRIPGAVQAAAETLACQFATACTGGECVLPARLAGLSRQGVDFTTAEVESIGGKIRTGIQEVDDVIAADNPHGLIAPPQILSPDLPPPGRVVTWAGGS